MSFYRGLAPFLLLAIASILGPIVAIVPADADAFRSLDPRPAIALGKLAAAVHRGEATTTNDGKLVLAHHHSESEEEATMTERTGELTFQGNPLTLLGPKLAVGHKAPDFTLLANDLSPVTLADSAGKVRLISVVPSLDTGVCDAQTRRFNEEAAGFGDQVIVYTVSADLPFAQARWCGAAGIERVQTLSDHRDMNFADAYGVHIKELRLDSRSVFIIDADDTIRYVEYVPEVAQAPDFDAAIAALKEVTG